MYVHAEALQVRTRACWTVTYGSITGCGRQGLCLVQGRRLLGTLKTQLQFLRYLRQMSRCMHVGY